MKKAIPFILLLLILQGCGLRALIPKEVRKQKRIERRANKKLSKVLQKYPFLVNSDTTFISDTTIIPEVRFDTVTQISSDTVTITKDHLKIRYVTVNDSIWIEGTCDTIEIIKEVPVHITTVKQVDVPKKYVPWWVYVIVGLSLLVMLAFAVIKLFIKRIL